MIGLPGAVGRSGDDAAFMRAQGLRLGLAPAARAEAEPAVCEAWTGPEMFDLPIDGAWRTCEIRILRIADGAAPARSPGSTRRGLQIPPLFSLRLDMARDESRLRLATASREEDALEVALHGRWVVDPERDRWPDRGGGPGRGGGRRSGARRCARAWVSTRKC